MECSEVFLYDYICYQICKVKGIRYAAIINNKGRKIAGGFSNKTIPLETDIQKQEMLLMEISLDLSMRKEFDSTLGQIKAIVSYRDKVNIITVPHDDNLLLISSDLELDPLKVIKMSYDNLSTIKPEGVIIA